MKEMQATDAASLTQRFRSGLQGLFPGYFAFVMATGIVSVASFGMGINWFALALVAINLVGYAVLCLLLLARLFLFPRRVLLDLGDHARGPGFFTLVAGTCVLGAQLLLVMGWSRAPTVLWLIGIGLWVVVMYGFFTAVIVRENKPSFEAGINGAWLIAIVATQSRECTFAGGDQCRRMCVAAMRGGEFGDRFGLQRFALQFA